MKKVIIQDQFFEMFPDFRREIAIVHSLQNRSSYKPVRKILKKEIDSRLGIDLAGEPRVHSWDDAHRKFGSTPEEYLPSIKSLLGRIQSNAALPFINSVVALFNYISLKYCLPCGGDDVAAIEGDLVLGLADGSETFQPLGSEITENPMPGEVIYFDSKTKNVMCRRWNWRNGDLTKIEVSSQSLVINIDCLPPVNDETGKEAQEELVALLQKYCKAGVETGSLNRNCRELVVG
jgi:lysyl-tRNA synthetase class 2